VLANNGVCTASATVNVNAYLALPNFTTTLAQSFACVPSGSTTATNTLFISPVGSYTLLSPGGVSNIPFTNSIIITPSVTVSS
jgi:hypothetical protein